MKFQCLGSRTAVGTYGVEGSSSPPIPPYHITLSIQPKDPVIFPRVPLKRLWVDGLREGDLGKGPAFIVGYVHLTLGGMWEGQLCVCAHVCVHVCVLHVCAHYKTVSKCISVLQY